MESRAPFPFALAVALLAIASVCAAQRSPAPPSPLAEDLKYVPGADSLQQPGVPVGETLELVLSDSRVFPGTSRKISVYIPAQYRAEKPACVYVALDGFLLSERYVFDNLIHKREMPVTIGIALPSGEVASSSAGNNPRFNRSLEFDSLSDDLARLLIDEVLPAVERHTTAAGLPILLSKNADDRAIGGASTGAIGAFTVAWQRPDAFRRVFSAVGTFVGMRGGDRYPVLVRKTEPKPIRIFMQDGSNDRLDGILGEVGDWWMANQMMERALTFSGYEVAHVWGDGSHHPRHPIAIFPEAMRFLWKDWPKPVWAGTSQNAFFKDVLVPDETWQPVAPDDPVAASILADSEHHRARGIDGREYRAEPSSGKIWLLSQGKRRTLIDSGLKEPRAIALSPDGLWLAVAEARTHWGYSYRVQSDGGVQAKQRFYWFHVPDDADDSGAAAWVADRQGRFYAATRMGLQIFDRNGRVRAIVPVPGGAVVALAFGGDQLDVLYVRNAAGSTFKRRFKVPGVMPGAPPIVLPTSMAG